MPREETRYFCDICGKAYFDKEKAIKCEKGHFIPESVTTPEYLKDDRKNEYPDSVLIHFKGGEAVRYYRSGR